MYLLCDEIRDEVNILGNGIWNKLLRTPFIFCQAFALVRRKNRIERWPVGKILYTVTPRTRKGSFRILLLQYHFLKFRKTIVFGYSLV